ncbi:uncharacterized protein FOMMEDRAFT_165747, partial [Fomitiporia mediterranea MF3/22]|uniref:uncharacterized protein n=1 Tax=Fomitiporia mediterranea (strain MF3/22) TaxID=694068 RepID=UPI00044095EC
MCRRTHTLVTREGMCSFPSTNNIAPVRTPVLVRKSGNTTYNRHSVPQLGVYGFRKTFSVNVRRIPRLVMNRSQSQISPSSTRSFETAAQLYY